MVRSTVALALVLALVSPTFAAGVTIIKHPGTVTPTGYAKTFATVAAATAPGAACTVTVTYKSGVSKAADLTPKNASAKGVVSWTWRIGTKTSKGKWPVVVACKGQGSAKTFVIVK